MNGLRVMLAAVVLLVGVAVLGLASADAAFVYACTPVASAGNSGGGTLATLAIYNPNITTVTVTAKWLSKTGTNLGGTTIPCTACSATNYPAVIGVAIPAGNTLITSYQLPDGGTLSGTVSTTIRIVADQPVNVGWNYATTFAMMCTESQ